MFKKQRAVTVAVTAIVVTFTVVGVAIGAGAGSFDSLSVGRQGVGGVTYFNGTIVNETTGTGGADNPVTFGDNVRIDGRLYRGATQGPGDSKSFTIDDDMEVKGSLTVVGNVNAANVSSLSAAIASIQNTVNASSVVATNNTNAIASLETKVTTAQTTADTAKTAADDARYWADTAYYGALNNKFVLECLRIVTEGWTYVYEYDIQYCYDSFWGATSSSVKAEFNGFDIDSFEPLNSENLKSYLEIKSKNISE